ncbi:hypothetical protein CIT25_24130 [Mesorhizobium mediterraneum]|uniref:Uncharacterized protein n=1 Tax=Mesorhizobium mediterraneum TaxID=43617 RepID=A0AB36R4S4_9HYPH|nr:hypothetical protein CIT25_24130 [Mesorhizobium mediterraneum]
MKALKYLKTHMFTGEVAKRERKTDEYFTEAPRTQVRCDCSICGQPFDQIQIGSRGLRQVCSQACRRERSRRRSEAYNAQGRALAAELVQRAEAGELRHLGINTQGQLSTSSPGSVDGKGNDA